MSGDVVGQSGPQRVGKFLGNVDSPAVLAQLCVWAQVQLEVFKEWRFEVAKLADDGFQLSVLEIWEKNLQAMQDATITRAAEVSLVVARNRRARAQRVLRPDAAQPGDVRVRWGETQVFVDGAWWALGPRRKP